MTVLIDGGALNQSVQVLRPATALVAAVRPDVQVISVLRPVVQRVTVSQIVGHQGSQGIAGPAGPPGVASNSPALLSYVHIQTIPATVWSITHPLEFQPTLTVIDSAGTVVEGDVAYLPDRTITVTFSAGFSGTAYLS